MARPRKTEVWFDILNRIYHGEGEWDLRDGEHLGRKPYSHRRLRHYAEQLEKNGLIARDPHFTGAEGEGVWNTILGRHWLPTEKGTKWLNETGRQIALGVQRKRGGNLGQGDAGPSHGKPSPEASPQTLLHIDPTLLPPARAEYLGAHKMTFRMNVRRLGTLADKFLWNQNDGMKGWVKRYAHIGELEVSLNGKPPSSVLVGMAVRSSNPFGAVLHATETVLRLKEMLEDAYDCHLHEPILLHHQKHTIVGDPVAAAVAAAGVRLHGDSGGIDNTPLPGSLELPTAEAAQAYIQMAENVLLLREMLPEQLALGRKGVEVLQAIETKLQALGEAILAQGQTQIAQGAVLQRLAEAFGLQMAQATATSSAASQSNEQGKVRKDDKSGYG